MRMPAQRLKPPNHDTVILGPCPGCSVWTLEYDDDTAATYFEACYEEIFEMSSEEPVDTVAYVDRGAWTSVVERALQDHYDECYGLRQLMA